ncbi:hypothetical protein SynMVIR181_02308 [Synechococcus sp. MVIR-18-1]|nr:hypothetical protein SynMVIR181_02308 [Synechococcus sp. MVIR-18-1]
MGLIYVVHKLNNRRIEKISCGYSFCKRFDVSETLQFCSVERLELTF